MFFVQTRWNSDTFESKHSFHVYHRKFVHSNKSLKNRVRSTISDAAGIPMISSKLYVSIITPFFAPGIFQNVIISFCLLISSIANNEHRMPKMSVINCFAFWKSIDFVWFELSKFLWNFNTNRDWPDSGNCFLECLFVSSFDLNEVFHSDTRILICFAHLLFPTKFGVFGFNWNFEAFNKITKHFIRWTTVTSFIRCWAVNEALNRERFQWTFLNSILAFDRTNRSKCPACITSSLISYWSHSKLVSPVNFFWQFRVINFN